jgi:Flp pilus assembly protein TadG
MTWKLSSIPLDERGNSFVEMALVLPVLVTLLLGTVDISRAVSTQLQLEQAAQRSIELVQRSNYSTTLNSTLQSEATTAAGSGSTATVSAWLECNNNSTQLDYDSGTCSSGQISARYVRVRVQSSFSPLFGAGFFPGANADGTVTMTGSAFVRTQ